MHYHWFQNIISNDSFMIFSVCCFRSKVQAGFDFFPKPLFLRVTIIQGERSRFPLGPQTKGFVFVFLKKNKAKCLCEISFRFWIWNLCC